MSFPSFIAYSGKLAQPVFLGGWVFFAGVLSVDFLYGDSAEDSAPIILAFGDSLTAGYEVSVSESYPARLQEIINDQGYNYKVVNGGLSGDTTAGGVRRIRWLMKHNPSIVVVELGANDGLRGLSLKEMESNLSSIISFCQDKGARILLAGMKVPPNYGEEYSADFEKVYSRLAKRFQIPLLPFFLENVAGKQELTQTDGLHPIASGYQIVAQNVWQSLEPLL